MRRIKDRWKRKTSIDALLRHRCNSAAWLRSRGICVLAGGWVKRWRTRWIHSVCPFNMKDLLLSLKGQNLRTSGSAVVAKECFKHSSESQYIQLEMVQQAQFRLFNNFFRSGYLMFFSFCWYIVLLFLLLQTVIIRKIHNILCFSVGFTVFLCYCSHKLYNTSLFPKQLVEFNSKRVKNSI